MRVGLVGTGAMAQVRLEALRAAGADVVVVCSRDPAKGRQFAERNDVRACVGELQSMIAVGLEAAVVEVPHDVQDRIVERLLRAGIHVLIGGPLARTWEHGHLLVEIARAHGLVLETGYEARYSAVWEFARAWVRQSTDAGAVVAVDTVALFDQPSGTWYTSEARSGGVAVTHLTYCFLNPLRWILGTPTVAGASRRKANARDDTLDGAIYSASLRYPTGVVCSLLGGYVRPPHGDPWSVTFTAEHQSLRIVPGDNAPSSSIRHYVGGVERLHWNDDPFRRQARVFLSAIAGTMETRAAGHDALEDLATASQIEKMATGANA